MSKRILELRRQQSEILTEARTISDKAGGEKRALDEAEASRFDELMGKADAFQKDIEREERAGSFAAAQQQGEDDPNRLGMGEGEVRAYSLTRAIRAAANHATGQRDAWKEAGLELEASQAVAKRMGRDPQGFFVPMDVQERRSPERRDLNVTTGSAGGDMVATDLLADSFIDLLRNRMVVRQAGATVLTGLQGDIAIPRQTGGATAYWVAESGAPTESQQTVDQVTLTPKTVGAYTDFSRKLLKQSSMDVERFVRADLTNVIALAIDLAALHGTGASNQPTGIAATSGIGSVAGGTNGLAPAWAHIVGLETEVAIDNADIGRLGKSPLRVHMESIGFGVALQSFGSTYFGNGARPGGVLEHPGRLSEQAIKRLEKDFNADHGGLENSHRLKILEEGMKYSPVGVPPEEAQFLESRVFQLGEMARIFRIQPHMVGDLSKSSNNNIEQQSLEHVIYTLQPWLVSIEQSLRRSLLLQNEKRNQSFEHAVNGLLRGDFAARYAGYAVGLAQRE